MTQRHVRRKAHAVAGVEVDGGLVTVVRPLKTPCLVHELYRLRARHGARSEDVGVVQETPPRKPLAPASRWDGLAGEQRCETREGSRTSRDDVKQVQLTGERSASESFGACEWPGEPRSSHVRDARVYLDRPWGPPVGCHRSRRNGEDDSRGAGGGEHRSAATAPGARANSGHPFSFRIPLFRWRPLRPARGPDFAAQPSTSQDRRATHQRRRQTSDSDDIDSSHHVG